ncbi:hypothetical protein J6590_015849 [Homalodisca vitripennis]|nr:hypothetical protein J6590_015849 [Homalodisca vitripennis]
MILRHSGPLWWRRSRVLERIIRWFDKMLEIVNFMVIDEDGWLSVTAVRERLLEYESLWLSLSKYLYGVF